MLIEKKRLNFRIWFLRKCNDKIEYDGFQWKAISIHLIHERNATIVLSVVQNFVFLKNNGECVFSNISIIFV